MIVLISLTVNCKKKLNRLYILLVKDTVALQVLYFLKIKIFISLDSCQFVEYLFKIKIYIFQFLKTKKGDNVSFVYFYKIITFV